MKTKNAVVNYRIHQNGWLKTTIHIYCKKFGTMQKESKRSQELNAEHITDTWSMDPFLPFGNVRNENNVAKERKLDSTMDWCMFWYMLLMHFPLLNHIVFFRNTYWVKLSTEYNLLHWFYKPLPFMWYLEWPTKYSSILPFLLINNRCIYLLGHYQDCAQYRESFFWCTHAL